MYVFTLTLLMPMVVSQGSHYRKCCKSTEIYTKVNSTYACVDSRLKRLDVLVNETDFVRQKSYGECVDVDEDFFVFNVSSEKVIRQSVVVNYFPKCCPIGYSYNSVLHSCEERENYTYYYIKENFVKVDLPNCKLIVDYELNEGLESYKSLQFVQDSLQYESPYCLDENEKGWFTLRVCKENIDICNFVKCVKKCCPDGQSFINRSQCYDTFIHGLNLSYFSMVDKPEDSFAVISNRSCKIYMLTEKYSFHLDEKGVFSLWSNRSQSFVIEDASHPNSYCIEHTKTKNLDGYYFFMCFAEKTVKKFEYTFWPKVLSCVCLMLTILVYVILDETKNVFGKVLVNYCMALFLENALLIYAQKSIHPIRLDCLLRGFFLTFLATASFTWSNVVCYDIWRTFGSTKRTLGQYYRKKVFRKLVPYFVYAWGVPVVVTSLVYLFYTYKVLPYAIQPLLGEVKCFFENRKDNYAKAVFLNLPELFMQLVNTVLFIKTAVYCFKIKKEISKIDDTTRDDKNKKFQKDMQRLFLILKLSVIMGLSFTFEVVSAFLDMKNMGEVPKHIEIVWDIINCLQGVFIFIIFICKGKVLSEICRKSKVINPRNSSSSSLYTQTTAISSGVKKSAGLEDANRKTTAAFR